MLASFLLPLAEWEQAGCTREYAFWLANRCRGRVHVLAVIDIKNFEVPVLGTADGFMPSVVSPPIAESQALLDELAHLARERLDQFTRLCTEAGVAASAEVRTGIPGDVIAREAVAHDMVLMSRTGYAAGAREVEKGIDPLISSVVRGSVRPVLVAGKEFPKSGAVKSILLAFDGSVNASRALNVALELAATPDVECTICAVTPTEEAGLEMLAPADAYLSHHGVKPKKKVVIGSKASEQLCGIAANVGADILIMGAYGHSPIREMFFGSTTERILNHCGATVILQS